MPLLHPGQHWPRAVHVPAAAINTHAKRGRAWHRLPGSAAVFQSTHERCAHTQWRAHNRRAKVEKRREVPQDLLDRVRHLSANIGAPKPQGALRGGTASRSRRYA